MSKKLLNEQAVRRFMKLANIRPLSEEFVERIYEQEDEDAPEMDAPER